MSQVYVHSFTAPSFGISSAQEPIHNRFQSQPNTKPIFQHSFFYNSEPDHLPMNNSKHTPFEISMRKEEMYSAKEDPAKHPREQLPPLSSLLFGSPAPRQGSSYSDGHSPVFPSTSPHEGSYFQRPPITQQYSYSSRSDQVERLGIPPPSFRYNPQYIPRHQGPPPLFSGWGEQQQSRAEYFPRATSSFRNPTSNYGENGYSAPPTPTYPPTPGSNASGEPTTKDGLGPKIWTGTQFLPRFVRQAEVTGEGMCYFYDDGTHCKTVIDGEIVNAHWGVTKAGKPRKRLAIACITCREKKIKCDPDYPRCVQCEKFGHVCKFKNAPRGGQGSPDTPPTDREDVSSRVDLDGYKSEKRESSLSMSPRERQPTPELEPHTKRQRNGYNDFTSVASEASPRHFEEATSPTEHWAQHSTTTTAPTPTEHSQLLKDWHTNPVLTQYVLVADLLSVFFKHVPETAYSMFPESLFKPWVLSSSDKSLDDLMLIYTVLAIGTVFSLKDEHKPFGTQFSAISRYACDNRPFTIQLVQSRVLLALYYFANNAAEESWDFCGAALRAASGLKLNLEIEKTEDARDTYPYGLTRAGYAECRRRTFWSCYVMDRFNGFCTGHLSIIHPEDVFLRLPCDSKSFEIQSDIKNPFFDCSMTTIPNKNWTVGSLSYLINISTIWGDVMANIYRASQSPVPMSSYKWQALHDSANCCLQAWQDSLPSYYTFSAANLSLAASNGKLGTFMTMHAVYYTTMMKLHRYMQVSLLSDAKVAYNLSIASKHAELLLSTMDTLSACRHKSLPTSPTNQRDMRMRLSSPFVGFAIVSAIDVLSAKLSPASAPARLASFAASESVMAELALFWQCSRNQKMQIQQRIRQWIEIGKEFEEAGGAETAAFTFGRFGGLVTEGEGGVLAFREPIEKTYPREFDCVYA